MMRTCTFAPLYRVVYDDLADSCYQFLRDAFEDYLHQHWWGLVCRRNKRMGEVAQTAHPRLTIPKAAKEANAPTSVVRHLVQASLIAEVSTHLPSGRRSRTIHVNDVPLLKEAMAGAVTLTQASQTLALPERRLRDLIKAKALSPLICRHRNPKAGAWLIPEKEINRFHVIPAHAPVSAMHLEEVRRVLKYWRLRDDEAVAHDGLRAHDVARQKESHQDGFTGRLQDSIACHQRKSLHKRGFLKN